MYYIFFFKKVFKKYFLVLNFYLFILGIVNLSLYIYVRED